MKLQVSEFANWSDADIETSLSPGLENLMHGLRYDSLSTYLYLDEYGTPNDPLSSLFNTDLRGLIEYKNGQDCYDVLFELLATIPSDLSPRIVGCPNNVHTTTRQINAAPYLHVAMTITDPRDDQMYLLDPGKWVTKPIKLVAGNAQKASDGNHFTVISVSDAGFIVDEHKVQKNRHDTLAYEWVHPTFDIDANYIGYMRLRERYNCITSVVENGQPPYYLKYLFDSGSFGYRLPSGQGVIDAQELIASHSEIDNSLGADGLAKRVLKFAEIFQRMPEGYWL